MGAWFVSDGGSTTMVTSSLRLNPPSVAVSRNVYVPGDEKTALVVTASLLLNVTKPLPFTSDHDAFTVLKGNPSSITEPCKSAVAGNVIVWSGPASTTGP